MTTFKVKKLEKYNSTLSDHIVSLNTILSEEASNANLTTYQREVIIGVRNQLKVERMDLQDYITSCKLITTKDTGVSND